MKISKCLEKCLQDSMVEVDIIQRINGFDCVVGKRQVICGDTLKSKIEGVIYILKENEDVV